MIDADEIVELIRKLFLWLPGDAAGRAEQALPPAEDF